MREYIINRIEKLASEHGLSHEGLDSDGGGHCSTFLVSEGELQGLFLELSPSEIKVVDYLQDDNISVREVVPLPSSLELFCGKVQELLACYQETNDFLDEYKARLANINSDLTVSLRQFQEIEREIDNA